MSENRIPKRSEVQKETTWATEDIFSSDNEWNKTFEEVSKKEAVEEVKAGKKYECKICKFVYEGESLPEGYECPICGRGTDDFVLIEE